MFVNNYEKNYIIYKNIYRLERKALPNGWKGTYRFKRNKLTAGAEYAKEDKKTSNYIIENNSIKLNENVNVDVVNIHLNIHEIDVKKLEKFNIENHNAENKEYRLNVKGAGNTSRIKIILDNGYAEYNAHRSNLSEKKIVSDLRINSIPRAYGLQNLYGTSLTELQLRYKKCVKELNEKGVIVSPNDSYISKIEYCLDFIANYNLRQLAKPIAYAVAPEVTNESKKPLSLENITYAKLGEDITPVEFRLDRDSYLLKIYSKSFEISSNTSNPTGTRIKSNVIRVEFVVKNAKDIRTQLGNKANILELTQNDIECAFLKLAKKNIYNRISKEKKASLIKLKRLVKRHYSNGDGLPSILLEVLSYERINAGCYLCLHKDELACLLTEQDQKLIDSLIKDELTRMLFSDANLEIQLDFLNHVILSADTYNKPYFVSYSIKKSLS